MAATNANAPTPAETEAAAAAAAKVAGKTIAETLFAFKVVHAQVGPHGQNELVSIQDVGGKENAARLVAAGALVAL